MGALLVGVSPVRGGLGPQPLRALEGVISVRSKLN